MTSKQKYYNKIVFNDCKHHLFTGCDAGYYCSATGKTAVTDKCNAGSYCVQNATKPNPTDGVTGNTCPVGTYCPRGAHVPLFCENGTYANVTGKCFPYVLMKVLLIDLLSLFVKMRPRLIDLIT